MNQDDGNRIDRLVDTIETLSAHLDELTTRVEALESDRKVESRAPVPKAPLAPAHPAPPASSALPPAPSAPAPSAATHAPSPVPSGLSDKARVLRERVSTSGNTEQVRNDKPKLGPGAFEWVLGIRGLMLLGVVIVIVGVGMFLKLAHDEGWIGQLSPPLRCAMGAGFGIALVGLGELLRKRLNPLASSGFSAAGLATVFASLLAANRMYALIGPELTFVLLALTTILGIMLGAIARRVMLSILSILGAFAVPVLLESTEPSFVVYPSYLLLLLTMGLVLSGWKGGAYEHVRRFAWWGTGIMGTLWLADMHDRSLLASMVFIGLAWSMTLIELGCSARFFLSMRPSIDWDPSRNVGFRVDARGERRFEWLSLLTREARWVNALFGATVWAVVAAGATIRAHDPELVYLAPLGFGVGSVVLLFCARRFLGSRLIADASSGASPGSVYLASLVINASVLGAATIAIALGGWVEVVAWFTVGLATIEMGRKLRFRAVSLFGISMIGVALGRLCSYDLVEWYDDPAKLTFSGLSVGLWGAQMIGASVACAIGSWRTPRTPERETLSVIAHWALAMCLVNPDTDPGSAGVAIAVLGAVVPWITRPISTDRVRSALTISAVTMISVGSFLFVFDTLRTPNPIDPIGAAIIAISWAALAAIPRAGFSIRSGCATMGILAGLLALGRVEHEYSLGIMLASHAALLLIVGLTGRTLFRWALVETTSVLVVLLVGAWAAHEWDLGADGLAQLPLSGPDSLTALLIAITLLWSGFVLPRLRTIDDAPAQHGNTRAMLRVLTLGCAWVFILSATTIEAIRAVTWVFDSKSAQGAGLSIWWSVFAVVSVILGFRFHRALRWSGLALLLIVAGKVLVYDTTMLAPTARIVAAISVGLVIIATGVLYTMFVKSREEPKPEMDAVKADSENT